MRSDHKRPKGRIGTISSRSWLPAYKRPKFSDVTVRSMDTGEVIRTEPAIVVARQKKTRPLK